MDLAIRGNDVEITDELRQFANRRVEGMDRLLGRVVDAKLELRRTHQRTAADAIAAQITIQTGRNVLRAEERDNDAQRAVDKVMNKIERQARRYHEKRSDRHGPRPGALDEFPLPTEVDADAEEAEGVASLVRTKRFGVKPMDPEEAIEQMELLGHDFYLFHNAEESQINVVYRRRDGTYGLLAPERS
ncbi:MAG: putative sigma-54 modulation protein [Thermomicrobiales bacterium]|jgi:putative sigma-54 modulation protein|nr:putative sigma-54 modulation protein [Thermomicrobiales bacterium]MEA2583743.1 putative sigma-54 modulation protein [Thermomicrobiales bacterium]MEA2596256.1 putative sigma-54 modulation protein [Thermomicrobiales bacterium]